MRLIAAAAAAVVAFAPLTMATGTRPPLDDCPSYTPYQYKGCYADTTPQAFIYRSLSNQYDMSIEDCTAECKGNGFRYAALKYYGICFCAAAFTAEKVDDSQCSYKCTGNDAQICGGESQLSVYEDPTFSKGPGDVTVGDYKAQGCFFDDADSGRALNFKVDTGSDPMTTNACLDTCRTLGFAYAGTEFGGECWCDSNVGVDSVKKPDADCSSACAGDASTMCGGPNRINIYYNSKLESSQPCGYQPPASSSSSSSISSTAVPPPPTTTPAPTSTVPTTPTSSAALCTVTTTSAPSCEFSCGNWCGPSLPEWRDKAGCLLAAKTCALQLASCFATAGWPGARNCFDFANWCGSVKEYCGANECRGSNNCNKQGCFNKYRPANMRPPTTTTTVVPCPTTLTSAVQSTTTTVCPPEPTNICTQPTNDRYGYGPDKPVGGIALPVVSCNDAKVDFPSKPFKYYSNPKSSNCPSFKWSQRPNVCQDACKQQFDDCQDTYTTGCRSSGGGNRWRKREAEAEAEPGTSVIDIQARTWGWIWNWFGNSNGGDNTCSNGDSQREWGKSGCDRLDCWGKGGNNADNADKRCRAQYKDCLNVNKRIDPGNSCRNWCQA